MLKRNKQAMVGVVSLLAMMVISVAAAYAADDYRVEILPTLIVGQAYEDNIFLSSTNKRSDFITTASPGVIVHVDSQKTVLDFEYFPTWVWYHDFSEKDTIRHNGRLDLRHEFTRRLRLDVKESYWRTEDPYLEALDPDLQTQTIRRTRNIYQQNEATASLHYQFGRQDSMTVGFGHRLLENEDPLLDDATEFGPFGSLAYWFDVRNGMEVSYRFNAYHYDREIGPPQNEDVQAHDAKVRYIHQFNPKTKGFVGYGLYARDFEGPRENYQAHEGRVGLEHLFDRNWSLSAEVGLFDPSGSLSADAGLVFSSRLSKKLKHGKIALGFDTGWDEGFLEAQVRGFTEYWGVQGSIDYQIQEKLNSYLGGAYRKNDRVFEGITDDETYIGQCGLKLEVQDWLFLGLEYAYVNYGSDSPAGEYADNRVLLTLSASHAFYPVGEKPPKKKADTPPAGTTGGR